MMSIFRSGAVLILSILLLEVSRTRAKVRIELPKNFFDEVKTKLTWSISKNYWPAVIGDIRNAFDFWENHTRFTFEEVSARGSPANIQIFNLWDLEEPYSVFTENNNTRADVARTMYNPKEQRGAIFITGFDTWKRFNKRQKNALNISSVVKHQLGYILGQKDTAAFSSTMTPSYQITNISKMGLEKKASYFFDIEVNHAMTAIQESYKIPQDICIPKINGEVSNRHVSYGLFLGKYVYDNVQDTVTPAHEYWPQLPENVTQIDGYYEDPRGFEIFFTDKQAYAFKNTKLLVERTSALNKWLKEEGVDRVDFLFIHRTGIFILKGERGWKFVQESVDNYTIKNVRVDFTSVRGYKKAIMDGEDNIIGWGIGDHIKFGWLGYACQPGQKGLVPPECCNL